MMLARRTGFTLLELMVALVIAAMVITLGRGLFDASTALTGRLTDRFRATEQNGVGRAALLRVFANARASQATPFTGSPIDVSFESWCPDPFGGFGPCTVRVSAQPMLTISERLLDGSTRPVLVDSTPGRFDYVLTAIEGGTTVREWNSATALPIAVRWITPAGTRAADTLMFAILRSQP